MSWKHLIKIRLTEDLDPNRPVLWAEKQNGSVCYVTVVRGKIGEDKPHGVWAGCPLRRDDFDIVKEHD